MIDDSVRRDAGGDDPQPTTVQGQAGDSAVTGLDGPPAGSDQEEADVLYLAGQRPPAGGAWLLVTAADGTPGGEFTSQVLLQAAASAFGGDVVMRLSADSPGSGQPPPAVRAEVYTAVAGRLIPVAV